MKAEQLIKPWLSPFSHQIILLLFISLLPMTTWPNDKFYELPGHNGIFNSETSVWKLETEKQGIRVFLTVLPDSDVKAFKAQTTVNASMASVFAVMDDPKTCEKWIYECTEGTILDKNNFSERFVYVLNDLPWPARTRDYILKIRNTSHNNGTRLVVYARSEPGMVPEKNPVKYVRIKKIMIHYELQQLSGNQTKITWIQHTEPSGNIPSWMANMNLTDIPFYSLNKLKELVKDSPYRNAQFKYGTEGEITGVEY